VKTKREALKRNKDTNRFKVSLRQCLKRKAGADTVVQAQQKHKPVGATPVVQGKKRHKPPDINTVVPAKQKRKSVGAATVVQKSSVKCTV